MNPVWPGARIYVDTYYGTDFSTSPDHQVLPVNESLLCSISTGRAVFLSDGITHHYAVVFSIDYKKRIVSLIDPWAPVSFLLAGHNVAGVAAKAYQGNNGQPLLDLSFDEFLRVVRGSVEAFNPEATFDAIEKLNPAYKQNEGYLFWKYSRLLSTNSWQRSVLPTAEMLHSNDFKGMPKLSLLTKWANDYIVAVISQFDVLRPGIGAKESDIPKLRQAYFDRLPQYAKDLPWTLKWLLLNRAQKSEDVELYGATLDHFVRTAPSDVDFLLRRAIFFLESGRDDEADSDLSRARTQWQSDVASAVTAGSAAESVAFLFRADYGLQSLAVLHWRYVRLQLTERRLALKRSRNSASDHDLALARIQANYPISSVLLDFFPDVLNDAYLSKAQNAKEAYIRAVSEMPDDKRRIQIFARTLFRHFNLVEDISHLSLETAKTLRQSLLGAELCNLLYQFQPHTSTVLTQSFARFCWARAFGLEGKWSTEKRCAPISTVDVRVTGSMVEIRDQGGRRRSEWITDTGRMGSDGTVTTQLSTTDFGSGPFRNDTPSKEASYSLPEPDEGFPVTLELSKFNTGPFAVREQHRRYRMKSDGQLEISVGGSKEQLTLIKCSGHSASGASEKAGSITEREPLLDAADSLERRALVERAIEVGASASRHRAYCGSFFAFSVDSKLPSGEYIQIRTRRGFVN